MEFEVVAVFDLMCSVLFIILHTAWSLTKDLYIEKKSGSAGKKSHNIEKKSLLSQTKRTPVAMEDLDTADLI